MPHQMQMQIKQYLHYSEFEIAGDKGKYYANRVKQWFSYLKLQYPEAQQLFSQLRLLTKSRDILQLLEQQRSDQEATWRRAV